VSRALKQSLTKNFANTWEEMFDSIIHQKKSLKLV
jgi:hypothetical protein